MIGDIVSYPLDLIEFYWVDFHGYFNSSTDYSHCFGHGDNSYNSVFVPKSGRVY